MIKGEYKISNSKGETLLHHFNLITKSGEEYFLRRWISQTSEVINSVGVSTGTNNPTWNDTGLNIVFENSEIVYPKFVTPSKKINLNNKEVILEATFPSDTINNTTEIGVYASNGTPTYNTVTGTYSNAVLISHDVYSKITAPSNSELTLNYRFSIDNSREVKSWTNYYIETSTGMINTNVYYINLNETIINIKEDNFTTYTQVESLDTVINQTGTYIQEDGKVYIHTTDSEKPDDHEINIEY